MPNLNDLIDQSRAIAAKIKYARQVLQSSDVLAFFRANPEMEIGLIQSARANLSSADQILNGMAELLNSTVLPRRQEIAVHPQDWLNVGDCIVGWVGYAVDRPRIIVGETPDGYQWRYLDENPDLIRNPVRNNPFFTFPGWHKIPLSGETLQEQVEEIHAYQDAELQALTAQIAWFESRQFLVQGG